MLEIRGPDNLPDALQQAWRADDFFGLEQLHLERARGSVRQGVRLLLAVVSWHLRRDEGELAQRWADEALALTRSQRLARDLRGEALLALSVATRRQGSFAQAEALAGAAARTRGEGGARLRAAALLAQATARRLSGDAWGSLMPMHAALTLLESPEGQVARALAWLDLDPLVTRPSAETLAGQVGGVLRARLAWHLAERALKAQSPSVARRWARCTRGAPFAQEEARRCPLTASLVKLDLQEGPPNGQVRVITLERLGLQTGDRFIPVPGDGRTLAVLAYLIHAGPSHWERVADAVLGAGTRDALYGQVRHHLSVARQLLGDPGAVTSRHGVICLNGGLSWACDALAPGAQGERPWFPALDGRWIREQRARLSGP